MLNPVCPQCGWEVDQPDYDDNIVMCRKCREFVVAIPEADLWPSDDLHDEDWKEQEKAQEMFETDSLNYGVEDDDFHGGDI